CIYRRLRRATDYEIRTYHVMAGSSSGCLHDRSARSPSPKRNLARSRLRLSRSRGRNDNKRSFGADRRHRTAKTKTEEGKGRTKSLRPCPVDFGQWFPLSFLSAPAPSRLFPQGRWLHGRPCLAIWPGYG